MRGNGQGKRDKKLEVREEVRYSESDKILSPAHKRFNNLSPLIALSNPAEPVEVSMCVSVLYGEQMRETEGESRSE